MCIRVNVHLLLFVSFELQDKLYAYKFPLKILPLSVAATFYIVRKFTHNEPAASSRENLSEFRESAPS